MEKAIVSLKRYRGLDYLAAFYKNRGANPNPLAVSSNTDLNRYDRLHFAED